MASITHRFTVSADPDDAWRAIADVARPHLLFPGVLTHAHLVEDDLREVTFADGPVARERIVAVDPLVRRLAYTVVGGAFEHHHASFLVEPADGGGSTITWTTDVLPHAAEPFVDGLMGKGVDAATTVLGSSVP